MRSLCDLLTDKEVLILLLVGAKLCTDDLKFSDNITERQMKLLKSEVLEILSKIEKHSSIIPPPKDSTSWSQKSI